MKRSGFTRKPGKVYATLSRGTPLKSKCAIKSRRRRVTKAEGGDYLTACRGEDCYLAVPGVCCFDRDTVVPCHDNRLAAGKGMGLKAAHDRTVPGCWRCHEWLDQGPAARDVKYSTFDAAFERWVPMRAAKMRAPMLEAA